MNRYHRAIFSGAGAFIAISMLCFASDLQSQWLFIMAPFGASAVLVFGIPASPLAQPKNVIFGHLLTAFIGLLFVQFIGVSPMSLGCATALAVSGMLVTETTHPPAGANPLLIMMTGQTWSFLFTPVLVGAISIVVIGKVMQQINARIEHKTLS